MLWNGWCGLFLVVDLGCLVLRFFDFFLGFERLDLADLANDWFLLPKLKYSEGRFLKL